MSQVIRCKCGWEYQQKYSDENIDSIFAGHLMFAKVHKDLNLLNRVMNVIQEYMVK
jgi:hypothetical protein